MSASPAAPVPDELLQRLRRFHDQAFPPYRAQFRELVETGQHPTTLFIGCSDSRLLPYLLTGAGPGEVFMVRNVGAIVPPFTGTGASSGAARGSTHHGTAAAIEYAVLNLGVHRIVVCGHSHCGAMRALYDDISPEAVNLGAWLDLAREAALPVRLFDPDAAESEHADGLRPEVLRRTEQRSIVLQLERLMDYPMVRRRVERGELALHGWYYVIEDGEVHVFDVRSGAFVPASRAEHSGTGPYGAADDTAVFNEIDESLAPRRLRTAVP
ncbi:MAG: carbonic anhydrase [Burkholderiaceae bacterium]